MFIIHILLSWILHSHCGSREGCKELALIHRGLRSTDRRLKCIWIEVWKTYWQRSEIILTEIVNWWSRTILELQGNDKLKRCWYLGYDRDEQVDKDKIEDIYIDRRIRLTWQSLGQLKQCRLIRQSQWQDLSFLHSSSYMLMVEADHNRTKVGSRVWSLDIHLLEQTQY